MQTKIQAAKMATASGADVWIVHGGQPGLMRSILAGESNGTHFHSQSKSLAPRQRWIAFGRKSKGAVVIDSGAVRALVQGGRSLLPAGVVETQGDFRKGDTIRVLDPAGTEVARGLSAYDAFSLEQIRGRKTQEFEKILGRPAAAEVIHRDNLVLL